jgi:hypothetical protein
MTSLRWSLRPCGFDLLVTEVRFLLSNSLHAPSKNAGGILVFLLEAIQGKLPEPNFELLALAPLLKLNLPILAQSLGSKFAETKRELLEIHAESVRRRAHRR